MEGEEGDVGLRVVAPSLVGDRAHHVPYHDQGKDLVEGRDGRSAADGASGRCAGWQDRALRLTEFALPTAQCGPFGIAAGPDGALWFAETAADRIGRITTDGSVTEYPLPCTGAFPSAITAAGDAVWFTMNQANAIGRIGMDGRITIHGLPTEAAAPVGIAASHDGGIWSTKIAAGQIGHRAPDGRITEYPLPDRSARPLAVTTDADGTVTVHDLPTPASEPHGITVGPDGALWTALETGALARISPTTRNTGQRNTP
ncbi:hypothetical protein [Streptomyces sp. Mg1]|uniref:Vgb family protein n=1 Tax=Streptomyces sp. Mg1 TaxID=465541 RepID=UPI00017F1890|nr:hypothetical protein [Streptomyces sp. Mg1]AKL70789.1 hypothetical protein M444_36090 [Streptomyces sp. Mg1]